MLVVYFGQLMCFRVFSFKPSYLYFYLVVRGYLKMFDAKQDRFNWIGVSNVFVLYIDEFKKKQKKNMFIF